MTHPLTEHQKKILKLALDKDDLRRSNDLLKHRLVNALDDIKVLRSKLETSDNNYQCLLEAFLELKRFTL